MLKLRLFLSLLGFNAHRHPLPPVPMDGNEICVGAGGPSKRLKPPRGFTLSQPSLTCALMTMRSSMAHGTRGLWEYVTCRADQQQSFSCCPSLLVFMPGFRTTSTHDLTYLKPDLLEVPKSDPAVNCSSPRYEWIQLSLVVLLNCRSISRRLFWRTLCPDNHRHTFSHLGTAMRTSVPGITGSLIHRVIFPNWASYLASGKVVRLQTLNRGTVRPLRPS